jgi:hypothetical protein
MRENDATVPQRLGGLVGLSAGQVHRDQFRTTNFTTTSNFISEESDVIDAPYIPTSKEHGSRMLVGLTLRRNQAYSSVSTPRSHPDARS